MLINIRETLIYGFNTIKVTLVLIGKLSEEAQKVRNKDIEKYQECSTRKNVSINNIQDLLNNLLVSLDPVISNLIKQTYTKEIKII